MFAGAREISIIDSRAVERCNRRLGTALHAAAFRRNLVVSGLDFAELVHCDLVIGAVRLRGNSSCPPCGYLWRLLGVDARAGLRSIGGVRAAVIQNGTLLPGMPVTT